MPAPSKAAILKLASSYSKAWTAHDGPAVADHFAPDGQITINGGDPMVGVDAITEMVNGFYAAFPDLHLMSDDVRVSGNHALFAWTFYGHHAETKNFAKISGWEEWEISEHAKIKTSRGWFDATEYAAQTIGTPT